MKLPTTLQRHRIASPLGPLLLAASDQGLAGVWFDDQQHRPLEATVAAWRENPQHPLLQQAAQQIGAYFQSAPGATQRFDLPLNLSAGTAFQQAVWRALLEIPAGATRSYAQVAQAVGRPAAVRAVGAAIGRNPLTIVVPCHRVVGSGGALTGYAGGLERKTALLALEGARISTQASPGAIPNPPH
jgi:methylated-DNA-[protein]-cysteine S-methyltransferase